MAILRGFSDRTQAVELMRELREYGQSAQGLQPQQTRQREAGELCQLQPLYWLCAKAQNLL